ncbi:MAG: deoxyguanosinetriphosphate triphosphohydrolase [Oscillospiraceae bacterium]|nr:deoxyguanosinetriphosphate triphosphohydrolase [Oscillospiraceae bacterium]
MNVREQREELEKKMLGPLAVRAADSKGRQRPEQECRTRTCFQHDVDRITYSKAFRRLKHKTQVFLLPEGDHYRTRLTHTLEVTRIARTIARALRLNEDLTEAVALGHDIGHTPFGHAGERALNEIMKNEGGFRHYEQSLRLVDRVENGGKGLNLTFEVRDGIVRHTCDPPAATLEGRVVRLADRIAYINHDVDDAIRAGILSGEDIPREIQAMLGGSYSGRINTLVADAIEASGQAGDIVLSPAIYFVLSGFEDFMYERVYKNPAAKKEEKKVLGLLSCIFGYYTEHPDELPEEYRVIAEKDGLRRAVCDYVSGMSDDFAVDTYKTLYIPEAWNVR